MYTYLEDLWDNSYGGVRDEILIQAKNLGATVGPDGGTLVALKNLRNNYDILMGKLFDAELVADDDFLAETPYHPDAGDGVTGYKDKYLNIEKTSGFPDPVTGAWDGSSVEDFGETYSSKAAKIAREKGISTDVDYYAILNIAGSKYQSAFLSLGELENFGDRIYDALDSFLNTYSPDGEYNIDDIAQAIEDQLLGLFTADLDGYDAWDDYVSLTRAIIQNLGDFDYSAGEWLGTDGSNDLNEISLLIIEKFGYGYASNTPAIADARLEISDVMYLLNLRDDT
jgi:hypothetical protein